MKKDKKGNPLPGPTPPKKQTGTNKARPKTEKELFDTLCDGPTLQEGQVAVPTSSKANTALGVPSWLARLRRG